MPDNLLEVQDLRTQFATEDGIVTAVDGVSFELPRGGTLGIVGESGCGKSVTSLSIMRLIPNPPGKIVAGRILFEGEDLLIKREREMRAIRGRDISMIFQEPMTSLNPIMTVGDQIIESIRLHRDDGRAQARARATEMLRRVGIPDSGEAPGDLSPPALRRHAPAGDDRHGAGHATRSSSLRMSRPPPWTSPSRPRS